MPTRKANYFESELIAPENIATRMFAIPVRYVPTLISAIETRKSRSFWESDDDFQRGYNILTDIQIMLLTPQDTYGLEQYNRLTQLYMLMDSIYNGAVYTSIVSPDGVVIPSPEIPGSPTQSPNPNIAPGLRQQLLNSQGVLNAGYFNGPARPATMADVVRTGQIQTDTEQGVIPDAVEDYVDLIVSGGGSASDALAALLQTTGDVLSDGGVVAAQLASSAALMAVLGLQGAQIDTLIAQQTTLIERLTYLTGANPPNATEFGASLPDYLSNAVAQRPTGGQGSLASLQNYLNIISADATSAANDLSVLRTQNNVNLSAVVALLRQMLGLEAVTDPIVGASLLVLAQCICNNTGQIADNTAPDVDQQNPMPADSVCAATAGQTWLQVQSWQLIGDDGTGGIPASVRIWRPDFGANVPGIVRLVDGAANNRVVYRNTIGQNRRICIAWNFTGNEMRDTLGRVISGSADFSADFPDWTTFPAAMPEGSRADDIQGSVDGQIRYYAWNFARPEELGPPPLNLWIRSVQI